MTEITRRGFFTLAGAASLSGAAILGGCVSSGDIPLSSTEAAAIRFRSVDVDVGQLVARGLAPWAQLVRASMQPELNRMFATRITPGDKRADRVVVRVDSIFLTSWAGSSGGGGWFDSGGGSDSDYMEGDALVMSPDGSVRAKYHILLALPASSAGAWYLPDIDNRRVVNLAQVFGQWVRDKIIGRR